MFSLRCVILCLLLAAMVSSPQPALAQGAAPALRTTEQQWIVQSILEDLARMALFAAKRAIPLDTAPIVTVVEKPADAQGAHFAATVQWPGAAKVEQAIDLPVHLWHADGYAKVAAGFLATMKLAPETGAAAPAGSPLQSLTAFDTATIEKENKRLSQWMTEHPLGAEAHAQSALLLAVFALRETSSAFADTRGALNRATAHLALAQALRKGGPPSDCAAVATLLLSLPIGRQSDTEAALDALEPRVAKHPELRPWLMAARLRERRNWRLLEDYAKATHLERVEYFRAYEAALGVDAVAKELEERKPATAVDWPRIALTRGITVSVGHVYVPTLIQSEMKEVFTIFKELGGEKALEAGATKLAAALNQTPHGAVAQRLAPKPTIEIIDRGAWALYFQRHLCHAIGQTHFFLQARYGVPEQAAQFRKYCDQMFGKLWLFPLAVCEQEFRVWFRQHQPSIAAFINQHPEWVEPRFWSAFLRVREPGAGSEIPPLEQFFTRPSPEGTLYGYIRLDSNGSRLGLFKELETTDPAKLDRLAALAPWSWEIALHVLQRKNNLQPTPQQTLKAMEPFLDHDVQAINACAKVLQEDPAAYARVMRKGAVFAPKNHITLMGYLRDRKFETEAAEAFEDAFKAGADPVTLSNNSDWVVNYYFDHGKKERAEEIATFAAEVYSHRGLATMARLRERQGRGHEAEEYFQKIGERYEDDGPLIAYYRRNGGDQAGSPNAEKLKGLLGDVFPKGLQKARLQDFQGAPKQGVLVAQVNAAVARAGLRLNDVIVALNGERTDTFEQYGVVRAFDDKPDMRLIVYRDGAGYLEIECSQPKRVFGADFQTYEGRPSATPKRAK